MALTPYQTEALVREVDDAVRKDDLQSFWLRYGIAIGVAVLLGLAAFGGWLFWQNHRTSVAEASSEQFAALLRSAQGSTLDQAAYDRLVAEGGPAYKTEAELVKAALAAGRGDAKAAAASYDAILADGSAPKPMRDAALIRKTALNFDAMSPDQVVAALKSLAVPGNAWFGSAGELTAVAHLKAGRREQAAELFDRLSRDAIVPDSIQLRAAQMASMLGSPAAPAGAQAK